jgi:hypothetical protein
MNKWLAIDRWPHRIIVPVLLIIAAVLAVTSLIGDSITYDETSHLTSGYSYLKTGDFRLAPENPPLVKMWAALPLLLVDNKWPSPEAKGWRNGDCWTVGKTWLFELNDGERMLPIARCMMVILLLATCLCIYGIGRTLFGPAAALLSLILAVFSPTLLAHGRLVTTDLPLALGILVTLWAFARLFDCITWGRLVLAALTLSALSLTKFSWLTVLPALALMGMIAVLRRQPIPCFLFTSKRPVDKQTDLQNCLLKSRFGRVIVMLLSVVFITAMVWAAIWTCFGWRYSPFHGADKNDATMPVPSSTTRQLAPINMKQTWEATLTDPQGLPMRGFMVDFVRWVRKHRLLPESYIYGFAFTLQSIRPGAHTSTWMGRVLKGGHILYFPIAFAIKTPIATMLLLAAGLSAVVTRRVLINRNFLLAAGLIGFAAVYGIFAITSHINIGHRHLVPIYPVVFIFAGPSVAWASSRLGRTFIAVAVLWLVCANLWIYPHYLAYFNELIGGPSRGYLYLTDSNIDWGQDLKRLAKYAKSHPDEDIKLAYFGIGNPTKYGFKCEQLRGGAWIGTPAKLTAGTYVISVMYLFGCYDVMTTDMVWGVPSNQRKYRADYQILTEPLPENASKAERLQRQKHIQHMQQFKQARLINKLRRRCPDERIGYSLFVYRLTAEQVNELIRP